MRLRVSGSRRQREMAVSTVNIILILDFGFAMSDLAHAPQIRALRNPPYCSSRLRRCGGRAVLFHQRSDFRVSTGHFAQGREQSGVFKGLLCFTLLPQKVTMYLGSQYPRPSATRWPDCFTHGSQSFPERLQRSFGMAGLHIAIHLNRCQPPGIRNLRLRLIARRFGSVPANSAAQGRRSARSASKR